MKTVPSTDYPRRILLIATGMSPQVVTETLYALAVLADPPMKPTEIHLLTTIKGARHARASLLHPDGGQYHALLADYPQIGRPCFDEQYIHVISDPDGKPLEDIRSPEENATAADYITTTVAELTRDPESILHVSLAGGRKTMSFYMGYAFSLYARAQDQLSHVLVSAPFESHPDFYYPPATPRRLSVPGGAHIDTAEARITLAVIPVVRLRHGLPETLQNGKARFNEAVDAVQKSLLPARLEIDLVRRQARCGETAFKLPPALIAWLAWWATQAKNGAPMKSWREFEVGMEGYLAIYSSVVGRDSAFLEGAMKRLRDSMEPQKFFEQNNAKLAKAFRKALGSAITARPYQLVRKGARGESRRGLALPPEAITFVTAQPHGQEK